jgi:WD40 repeat protein
VYCGGPWNFVVERDLDSGAPTGRQMDQAGTAIAVTDSGTRLVTIGGARPALSSWQLDGGGAAQRLVARGAETLRGGYSPSGELLLVHDRGPELPPWQEAEVDIQVSVWDVESDRATAMIEGPIVDPSWAGEDRIVAYFPDAGRFQIVDINDGSVLATLPTTASGVWATSGGTRLHVMVAGEEVWTYETASGRRIAPTFGFDGDLWGLTASPDGARLALTSVDAATGAMTTSIVDAESGDVIASEPLGVAPIAMPSDSEFIGALGDGRVARYAVETMEPIGALTGSPGGTHALSVSDDGGTLLMASADQTAMLFDLPSGVRFGDSLRAEWPQLRPDGAEVAANAAEGIVLWDLNPETQFEALCHIAGRDLTEGEWATHLADLGEPRSTCDLDRG